MRLEQTLRLFAGFFVLISVLLAYLHSPYWLIFTLFVGFNLFQSGFTNWCPMMFLLKLCGLKSCEQEPAHLKNDLPLY